LLGECVVCLGVLQSQHKACDRINCSEFYEGHNHIEVAVWIAGHSYATSFGRSDFLGSWCLSCENCQTGGPGFFVLPLSYLSCSCGVHVPLHKLYQSRWLPVLATASIMTDIARSSAFDDSWLW
jgi:hypothetical protein